MDNEEQIPVHVHAEDGVARFFLRASIQQPKERIEEGFRGLLERDSMFGKVLSGFRLIPDESDSVQLETIIHE